MIPYFFTPDMREKMKNPQKKEDHAGIRNHASKTYDTGAGEPPSIQRYDKKSSIAREQGNSKP
jgi:hypothetical protein